jgi:hypothetical protein
VPIHKCNEERDDRYQQNEERADRYQQLEEYLKAKEWEKADADRDRAA